MDAKKISILSTIAASSCCLPPLILLGLTLLGVGTTGVAGLSSALGSIKWYILPLAMAGVGLSYWLYFRQKKACATTACMMVNQQLTKGLLTFSTVVVFGFFAWSVYPYVLGVNPAPTSDSASSAHFAVYQVDGMTCGGCEVAVNGAVDATGIVDSVKSSFTDEKAYIWYRDDDVDLADFEEAIRKVGYKPKLLETH